VAERNRVSPTGEILAIPLRGAFTGNRGRLHPESGEHEIVRFHAHDSWVTCALEFNDRWNEQWLPHKLTWLYFQDEAVSFAAGHRPCGECRYRAYKDYQAAWAEASGGELPSAKEMNRALHRERIVRGTHRRRLHAMPWTELPEGAFVMSEGVPELVLGDELVAWTTAGYGARRARPRGGTAEALTPPATLAILRAGYPVQIDAGATG
jgi:hypothetical protein